MRRSSWLPAILFLSCALKPAPDQPSPRQPETSAAAAASVDVAFNPVKAMLAENCAPCHNPGGKMYATLPFDNPDVVRSHAEGIERRLKAPEDAKVIQQWLDGQAQRSHR